MKTSRIVSTISALLLSSYAHGTEEQVANTSHFKTIAIPFYDPSVGVGASLVPIYTFYSGEQETDPSTLSATLTYTESKSYNVRGKTDVLLDKFRVVTDFGYNHSNIDVQLLEQIDSVSTTQHEINFFGEIGRASCRERVCMFV